MKQKLLLLAIILIAHAPFMNAATDIYNYSYTLNVGQYVDMYMQYGSGSVNITNSSPEVVAATDLGFVKGKRYARFSAIKRGTAQLAVNYGSYHLYYVTVKVVDVVSVTLPPTLSLTVGDEYNFTPIIADPEATTSLTYHSYNTDVATVDPNGKLTAKNVGTASIVCAAANGIAGQCLVTVNPLMLVNSISLSTTSVDMTIGATRQIYPIIMPDNAANKTVSWETSDADVATVDDEGNITAVGVGKATITATSTDGTYKSATCAVNVLPIVAKSVALDTESIELSAGSTYQLTATVLPEDVQQRVSWSSSDKTIAKVLGGVIYALDWGECLITATTVDGSNLIANCFVTVTPPQTNTGGNGDVDGNGTINGSDVTALYNLLLAQ